MIKRLDYIELVEINTIHEFLWSVISNYQVNLKKELIDYHDSELDSDKQIENLSEVLSKINITY
jgi:DNA helicase-2/ATP-dependent DNA helicase PcrA